MDQQARASGELHPKNAGSHPIHYYRAGLLKYWLDEHAPGDVAATRLDVGHLSFAHQYAVLWWAARNISKEFAGEAFSKHVISKLDANLREQIKTPHFLTGLATGRVDGRHLDASVRNEILLSTIKTAARVVEAAITNGDGATRCLFRPNADPGVCLSEILNKAGIPPPVFADSRRYTPVINSFLGQKPNVSPAHPWALQAKDFRQTLALPTTDRESRRVIIISGPLFSGRMTIVRQLISPLVRDYNHFLLSDGSALPTLALRSGGSVGQLLNLALNFYRTNLGIKNQTAPDDPKISTRRNALAELKECAREFPVFFVMNDVALVGGDPGLRALQSDHVGEIMDTIITAHLQTRAVITTESDQCAQALAHLLSDRGISIQIHSRPTGRRTSWESSSNVEMSPQVAEISSWQVQMTGLTWIMSGILGGRLYSAKAAGLAEWREKTLRDEWRFATQTNNPELLLHILWHSRLLKRPHRILMGVVGSSPDGLKESELLHLLRAARRERGGSKVPETLCTLEDLRDAIEDMGRLLEKTEPQRDSTPDMPLLGALQREASYSLLPWRRQATLREWLRSAPDDALSAQWYFARLAEMRAKTLDQSPYWYDRDEAKARRIQAINALVASISVSNLIEPGERPEQIAAPDCDYLFPSLEEHSVRQPDTVLLQQAASVVFGDEDHPLNKAIFSADASTILSTLAHFFNPGIPWLTGEQWSLSEHLSAYPHLDRVLPPRQTIALLSRTAQTALGIRRFDVVIAASRLAQQILRLNPSLCPAAAQDIFTAEIDASMVSGRDINQLMPRTPRVVKPLNSTDVFDFELGGKLQDAAARDSTDVFDFELGGKLQEVAARARELVNTYYKGKGIALASARAVLVSREGEALNLAGRLDEAEKRFVAADTIQRELVTEGAAPFLSRRSSRRAARVMLHIARKAGWDRNSVPPAARNVYSADAEGPIKHLMLPVPSYVEPRNAHLLQALKLIEVAGRSAGKMTATDDIGQRVIEARAAALCFDFDRSMRLIEEARSLSSFDSIGVEILLELTAVGAQLYLDTATILLVEPLCKIPRPRIDQLSSAAKFDGDDPIALARHLVERAERSLRGLAVFSGRDEFCDLRPYAVFCRYMEGLSKILRAVLANRPDDQLSRLREGEFGLTRALVQMNLSGYKLFRTEAKAWRKHTRAAIDRFCGG